MPCFAGLWKPRRQPPSYHVLQLRSLLAAQQANPFSCLCRKYSTRKNQCVTSIAAECAAAAMRPHSAVGVWCSLSRFAFWPIRLRCFMCVCGPFQLQLHLCGISGVRTGHANKKAFLELLVLRCPMCGIHVYRCKCVFCESIQSTGARYAIGSRNLQIREQCHSYSRWTQQMERVLEHPTPQSEYGCVQLRARVARSA